MTPRDAVREAVYRAMQQVQGPAWEALAGALGIKPYTDLQESRDPNAEVADALLGRAEPQGEAVAWGLTYAGELLCDAVFRNEDEALVELNARNTQTPQYAHNRNTIPLYTRPAPVVTEAMCKAAMQEFSAQIGEPFASVWEQMGEAERTELLDDWRHILTAALAQGRTP